MECNNLQRLHWSSTRNGIGALPPQRKKDSRLLNRLPDSPEKRDGDRQPRERDQRPFADLRLGECLGVGHERISWLRNREGFSWDRNNIQET